MADKVIKKLVLKCKDKKVELKFHTARVFATRYEKLLELNEFHAPAACKLIVESDDRIWNFLLSKPFIIVDQKGNVEVLTTAPYKHVSLAEPYATDDEIKEAKHLAKAYKYKSALGLTAIEAMEKSRVEAIVNVANAKAIKVPYKIGGGF